MNFFANSKYGACCMKQDVESRVMLDTLKCNKYGNLYMSSIIWLKSQLFEKACFVNLCLVDGFVHQYVRVHGHIHMMWIFFFFEGEKWCVFSLMVLFVTRRHKILRRSTLEREPHDYNLSVRIKWECILILKTSRILSYLGLKHSFLNLKYHGVLFQCLNPQP